MMIAVGIPLVAFASANAAASWSKSLPSATLITWKLNASNFYQLDKESIHHQLLRQSTNHVIYDHYKIVKLSYDLRT